MAGRCDPALDAGERVPATHFPVQVEPALKLEKLLWKMGGRDAFPPG
jgi:hypothetical protein